MTLIELIEISKLSQINKSSSFFRSRQQISFTKLISIGFPLILIEEKIYILHKFFFTFSFFEFSLIPKTFSFSCKKDCSISLANSLILIIFLDCV